MLIRTQDKKEIINFSRITSIGIADEVHVKVFSDDAYWSIGKYESEQRAIEVLSRIQDEWMYWQHYSHSGVVDNSCQGPYCYGAYQMPEK